MQVNAVLLGINLYKEKRSGKMKGICAEPRFACISFQECEQTLNSVWKKKKKNNVYILRLRKTRFESSQATFIYIL